MADPKLIFFNETLDKNSVQLKESNYIRWANILVSPVVYRTVKISQDNR